MAQLSTLDLIERKTAIALIMSEDIIAKVIRHKWKSLHDATNEYRSVEDSGLGKFTIRTKKITRRLERLNDIILACENRLVNTELTEKEEKKYLSILRKSSEEKEYLETKI